MKRIAAHRMVLDNQEFINHVVEIDDTGKTVKHYPLAGEIAMCEWRNRYDKQG